MLHDAGLDDWHGFSRLISAAAIAFADYIVALGSVPSTLGMIAVIVMLAAGWREIRSDRLAKPMDAHFSMLRHLQRLPSGEPLED
jgi:hypothetical protein